MGRNTRNWEEIKDNRKWEGRDGWIFFVIVDPYLWKRLRMVMMITLMRMSLGIGSLGHVLRMDTQRLVKKVYKWK